MLRPPLRIVSSMTSSISSLSSPSLLRKMCQRKFKMTSSFFSSTSSFSSEPKGFNVEEFSESFLKELKGVPEATDPLTSSRELRKLVKSKKLLFTDMKDNPRKFFLAHRLLSTVGLGGFGIRFTVQYNLFAGSILGLGGPDQVQLLKELQNDGKLGCFLLTEMQAGVLSGLIVKTTAEWDIEKQKFILNTPNDAAAKNWISQGYTAELGVVIADLKINGKSLGPHPFLIELRDEAEGTLRPGIRIEDMGVKTVANDLDNARVWFENVHLPKDSLLNKYCEINELNEYTSKGEKMRIEVIGQRLLTGRLAIAQSALVSCRVLHMKTESYAKKKLCNDLSGEVPLYSMPQLKNVFENSYAELDKLLSYTAAVEERLNYCLLNDTIPNSELVDAISVAKIRSIRSAIERAHALRLEVGSYALMHKTGFELMDMFLCCKFAEGDSRILQMKLMRDRLKNIKKEGVWRLVLQAFNGNAREVFVAMNLARKLHNAKGNPEQTNALLKKHWKEIYDLAHLIENQFLIKYQDQSELPERIVERFSPSSSVFDIHWKKKLGKFNTRA